MILLPTSGTIGHDIVRRWIVGVSTCSMLLCTYILYSNNTNYLSIRSYTLTSCSYFILKQTAKQSSVDIRYVRKESWPWYCSSNSFHVYNCNLLQSLRWLQWRDKKTAPFKEASHWYVDWRNLVSNMHWLASVVVVYFCSSTAIQRYAQLAFHQLD